MAVSDWQARVGASPVQGVGTVVTTVQLRNPVTGQGPFTPDLVNDGTVAGLTAAVKAFILSHDPASGGRQVVAPGTVLDLSDPAPPPPPPAPPTPTQADIDRGNWFAAYAHLQRLQRAHGLGVVAISAQNVSDAQSALNALTYDPSYETFL